MMAIVAILTFLILGAGCASLLSRRVVEKNIALPAAFTVTLFITAGCYFVTLACTLPLWMVPAVSLLAGVSLLLVNRPAALFGQVKPVVASILCVTALILSLKFYQYVYRWGDWDAWAIWNLHAKFLFYPEHWSQYFTQKMTETHPDYPLMLPSFVAYFWRCLGFITPVTPILIAWGVCLAVPLSVFAGTYRNGNFAPGVVALFIFLADPKYLSLAGSQYADTLVALFILVTVMIYLQTGKQRNTFALLGFMAAATANIKNEGLLFFAVFSLLVLLYHFRQPARIIGYGIGAIFPLLFVVYLKTSLAPPNDIMDPNRGSSVWVLITESSRYLLIISKLTETLIKSYWYLILLPLLMWLTGIKKVDSFPLWLFALMMSGYIVVYATTPHDLRWHLEQSADRIIHHLAPAAIYVLINQMAATAQLKAADY